MASLRADILKFKGVHTVGHLATTSRNLETVINGAIVKSGNSPETLTIGTMRTGLDNFILAELYIDSTIAGTDDFGFCVKKVSSSTDDDDLVLLITPEQRLADEPLCNFFNADGERATCAYLKKGLAFDTSAYKPITSGSKTLDPVPGQYATFDATEQKFVISASKPASGKVFRVIAFEDDVNYTIDDYPLVTLQVM